MKFRFTLNSIIIISIILIPLFWSCQNNSTQNTIPAALDTIPEMNINSDLGKELTLEFKKSQNHVSKFDLLSQGLGKKSEVASYNYSQKTVDSLLHLMGHENNNYTHLAIYIAAIKNFKNTKVNGFQDSTLALIFAPMKDSFHLANNFYIIKESDSSIIKITKDIKDSMIALYENIKMPLLDSSIVDCSSDPCNYPNRDITKTYSDTKYLIYPRKNIEDFVIKESNYQNQRNGHQINGIQINFASHRDKELDFRKRLFILFELTEIKNGKIKVVDIDKEKDYTQRPCPANKNECKEKTNKIFSGNNGQLCPANCPI